MSLTRRSFLGSVGTLPIAVRSLASAEGVARPATAPSPILLNSNENAYGPSPRVMAALRDALASAHRYPDRPREDFAERVAKLHRVSADQVVLGCGSAEILKACANAFTGSGKKLIIAAPTFEVIGRFAEVGGAQVVKVPLSADFSHDLDGMLSKVGDDTGLVYVCNPNNPTASVTRRRDLEAFIAKLPTQTHVLIDEAYHHFAVGSDAYSSLLEPRLENDRVIVSRTFSKIYGLAGMRLGYGVGSVSTIEQLRRFTTPENGNIAALRSALAALEDDQSLAAAIRRNAADRAEFMRQARTRSLSPIPSYANFAMMDVGRPVQAVIERFKQHGILVGRPFPPMNTHLRVTFGLPHEMKKFWQSWDALSKSS